MAVAFPPLIDTIDALQQLQLQPPPPPPSPLPPPLPAPPTDTVYPPINGPLPTPPPVVRQKAFFIARGP